MNVSEIGALNERFNDWCLNQFGARWQFIFALGFVAGFCTVVSL